MVFIPVNASRQLYVAFPRVMARVIARSPSDYTFEGKIQKIWAFHSWLVRLHDFTNNIRNLQLLGWVSIHLWDPGFKIWFPTMSDNHYSVQVEMGPQWSAINLSLTSVRLLCCTHTGAGAMKWMPDVNGIHFLTDEEGNQLAWRSSFFLRNMVRHSRSSASNMALGWWGLQQFYRNHQWSPVIPRTELTVGCFFELRFFPAI